MTDGERLAEIVVAAVARGDAPGVVAAVGRGDATYVKAAGTMAIGGPPMRADTLFRIASITKPVTAAAVLSLADEGVLDLDEPVDRLLPELADRRVLRRPDGPLTDTVAAAAVPRRGGRAGVHGGGPAGVRPEVPAVCDEVLSWASASR